MASVPTCPSCGETDRLRGESTDHGIEIVCERCGERWERGELTCRSCHGSEALMLPQVIARTSRGNQLSIMGHRDVTLCTTCDADVIVSCRTTRQWVPEDYVSAWAFDASEARPIHGVVAPVSSANVDASPEPERRVSESAPDRPSPVRRPHKSPAAKPVARPTVRQAIQEYMTAEPGADPLAMLSLGTFLGSSTRLEELGARGQGGSLHEWFRETWGDHDATRQAAVHQNVRDVFCFWVANGWICRDPTVELEV